MKDYNSFFNSAENSRYEPAPALRGEIPWSAVFTYLFLAIVFCFLYHIKIVAPVDWNAPNSINAVASFDTAKPYQFRLLIPLFIIQAEPFYSLHGKYVYYIYNVAVVFITLLLFYKMIAGRFFKENRVLWWYAAVILYPMLWNYIILNQSFQYYDFTSILIFTAGLYFISRESFAGLLIIFIIGLVNKETIGYLIFSYVFYNYKSLFKPQIILKTAVLCSLFIGWKFLLNYIFRENPGDSFEVGYYENIRIIKELFSNKVLLKNLTLNFGGLYIIIIVFFITGAWKKFYDRKLVYMNLAIIPFYIFGIYITYITEVRVYTELIPMITILFLIYLSGFQWTGLKPSLQPKNSSDIEHTK